MHSSYIITPTLSKTHKQHQQHRTKHIDTRYTWFNLVWVYAHQLLLLLYQSSCFLHSSAPMHKTIEPNSPENRRYVRSSLDSPFQNQVKAQNQLLISNIANSHIMLWLYYAISNWLYTYRIHCHFECGKCFLLYLSQHGI